MKILKWILIIVIVLALLFVFVLMPSGKTQTKKHSPEKTTTYSKNGMDLSVNYSSPFKKGRAIFGELVPYNEVWRTGANEPTTFTTKSDIKIIDKSLAAGTYSLWTRPGRESWSVMFNTEIPEWGVTILSGGKKTSRDPAKDAVKVEVPVLSLSQPTESFTIDFEEENQLYLSIYWDTTKIKIPINN